MKDNSETRGSDTGTQAKNQSDNDTRMKGSQPLKEGQRPAGSTSGRPDPRKKQPSQSSGTASQPSSG
jgi:hypothetical protein